MLKQIKIKANCEFWNESYNTHSYFKEKINMDKIVLYLIGSFFVIGGIDYILGSPLKLGVKFEEGIKTMGALGLGMIGIYSLAPILSNLLSYYDYSYL